MVHFLFAIQREADMFDLPNKTVIGVGGADLPHIDENDTVVNIGLCGGYKYPIGEVVVPTVIMTEDEFIHSKTDEAGTNENICVTAKDFVEKPLQDIPAICVQNRQDRCAVLLPAWLFLIKTDTVKSICAIHGVCFPLLRSI